MAVDQDKVMEFLERFVADLGAAHAAGSVVIGHRLGLYAALAHAPASPEQLAHRTDCSPRYVTEWLCGQAAGGYVSYDPATGQFSMTEEQVFCLADPTGPVYLPAAFLITLGMLRAEPQITERFRTGEGFAWGAHSDDVAIGCERFFRPGYVANLVSSWLPAVNGLVDRLEQGIAVADVGCGLGSSTRILAETYPASTLTGFDNDPVSIELADKLAADAGLGDRVAFAVAAAADFPGSDLGLVTTFDCLHDMGDPVGAARHIRRRSAPTACG